jgi:long-chain fatty acid transport protein
MGWLAKLKFIYRLMLALALLSLNPISIWAGNGAYLLGFGANAVGRGGADVAVAQDALSMQLNPAGISQIKGQKLEFAPLIGIAFLHYQNPWNDTYGKRKPFLIPSIAWVKSFEDNPWSVGVLFYTPGGISTYYKLRNPLYEDRITYRSALFSARLVPTIAYRFSPRVMFGLSPIFSYNRLDVRQPFGTTQEKATMIAKGIGLPGVTFGELLKNIPVDEFVSYGEMEKADAFAFGFSFGFLLRISDQLTLGASYLSKQEFDWKGGMTLDVTRQLYSLGPLFENILPLLPNQGREGFAGRWKFRNSWGFPRKITIGFSYLPREKLRISGDFSWIDWSDIYDRFTIILTRGNNADLNKIVGSDGFRNSVNVKWKDGYIYSIGIEYEYNHKISLRAGFAHGNNVVPARILVPTGPAITKDHLTVGLSYKKERWEFSMAFEHNFFNEESSRIGNEVGSEHFFSKCSIQAELFHFLLSYHF